MYLELSPVMYWGLFSPLQYLLLKIAHDHPDCCALFFIDASLPQNIVPAHPITLRGPQSPLQPKGPGSSLTSPPLCFLLAYLSPDTPSFLLFLEGSTFISILGFSVLVWNVLPAHLLSTGPLLPSTSQLNYHFLMSHPRLLPNTFVLACLFSYCLSISSSSVKPMTEGTCWLVRWCPPSAQHGAGSVTISWTNTCHRVALRVKCLGHPPYMKPLAMVLLLPPSNRMWTSRPLAALPLSKTQNFSYIINRTYSSHEALWSFIRLHLLLLILLSW